MWVERNHKTIYFSSNRLHLVDPFDANEPCNLINFIISQICFMYVSNSKRETKSIH